MIREGAPAGHFGSETRWEVGDGVVSACNAQSDDCGAICQLQFLDATSQLSQLGGTARAVASARNGCRTVPTYEENVGPDGLGPSAGRPL